MVRSRRLQTPERVVLIFVFDDDDGKRLERTIALTPNFPYLELRATGNMLGAEGFFVPVYGLPSARLVPAEPASASGRVSRCQS